MKAKVIPFEKDRSAIETSQMFAWLKQVQADCAITGNGFKLAFALQQHVRRASGLAWPTQETLAKEINVSDRTIRTLADALIENGHIAVSHGHGKNTPNRYRLIWKNETGLNDESRKPASGYERDKEEADFRSNDQNAEAGFRISSIKPEEDFLLSDRMTGNSLQDDRKFSALNTEASFLQNQPQEPTSINSETKVSKPPSPERPKSFSPNSSALDEDAKTILFRDGLKWLAGKTGKPEAATRSAIGQMLKLAGGDTMAGVVLDLVKKAKKEEAGEPVSWIMGCLRARAKPRPNSFHGEGAI